MIEFRRKHIGWATWKAFFTDYKEAKRESELLFPEFKAKDIRIACWSRGRGYLSAKSDPPASIGAKQDLK